MKALVLTPAKATAAVTDIPRPIPKPGEVLIRVHAVALNSVDNIFVADPIATQDQRVIGTDFAGVVVGASQELQGSGDPRTKNGARVAGFLQGACSANDLPGAFGQYAVAPYDLIWTIPADMDFEGASTVSMCGLTAAQALFDRLKLPSPFTSAPAALPADDPINILVYGSSSSLGLFIAELAHLVTQTSGRKIRLLGAATADKHDLLLKAPYNYDFLVDYHDQDWPQKVRDATDGKGINFALDTISEGSTVENVHATLAQDAKYHLFGGPAAGKYDLSNLRLQPIFGGVWEAWGIDVVYNSGIVFPARKEARTFAVKFFDFLASGAVDGQVKLHPNPVRVMPGGLERVVADGLPLVGRPVSQRPRSTREEDYMRPISAEKLVYRVA